MYYHFIAMHQLFRGVLPSTGIRLSQWWEGSRAGGLLLRRLCRRPLSSEAEQSASGTTTTTTKSPSADASEAPLAETLKSELQSKEQQLKELKVGLGCRRWSWVRGTIATDHVF